MDPERDSTVNDLSLGPAVHTRPVWGRVTRRRVFGVCADPTRASRRSDSIRFEELQVVPKLTTRLGSGGGADRVRTDDLRLAKPALSQLSYSPIDATRQAHMVGLGRFELPTSRLSGVRSNQLSYRPAGHERPSTAFVGLECIDMHRSLAGDRPSLVPSNRSQLAIHSGSVPKN